jgi:hypothetical protein
MQVWELRQPTDSVADNTKLSVGLNSSETL